MSKPDQFADLLSFTTKRKDDSKLSLAERKKLESQKSSVSSIQSSSASNWDQFDVLLAQKSNAQKTSIPSSRASVSTSNTDLFEGFDVINSTVIPQGRSPQVRTEDLFEGFGNVPGSGSGPVKATANSDLLDDLGLGESSSASSNSEIPQQQHAVKDDIDDLFSVFDKPKTVNSKDHPIQTPIPIHTPQSNGLLNKEPSQRTVKAKSNESNSAGNLRNSKASNANSCARDEALSLLIDMGFSIEQAADALDHTANGTNVQEAINYIMTDAHNKTRAKAGLPPQRNAALQSSSSSSFNFSTFSHLVTDISDKLMTDVSNKLFAPPPSDGRPAWMRDQGKYIRKSTFDEEPKEVDQEMLDKLVTENKNSADIHRIVRAPEVPHPRKSHVHSVEIQRQRQAKPPVQSKPKKEPQRTPEVDIFGPLPGNNTASKNLTTDLFETSNTGQVQEVKAKGTPSPATLSRPFVAVGQLEMITFQEFRDKGGDSFKRGDFVSAAEQYETSLQALPATHTLRILAYSNCMTAYLKTGDNKKVVEYANKALSLIGDQKGVGEFVEDTKPMKTFWVKILQKKAEALEHLEKYRESLEAYTELIENGAATKVTLDGRRRCQDILNPKPRAASRTEKSPIQSSKPISSPSVPTTMKETDALKRVRENNKATETFQAEKFKLHDEIEARVGNWKNGKEDNLRALLASLNDVLWPSSNWKNVSMAELVMPKKVKIVYMRAVAKTHPDKIPNNADAEIKLIAQNVFVVINQAWEIFKVQNNLV